MPLLNEAADLHIGSTRADVAYQNGVQVWPNPEIWSAWMMVASDGASTTADKSWFDTSRAVNYDTGGHEMMRWRYSNKGRVHYRGIMKAVIALSAGWTIVGTNIVGSSTIPMPPKTVDDYRMVYGVSGAKADMGGYGGTTVRYNISPWAAYHHGLQIAVHDASAIAAGAWFAIDAIFSFAADT